MLAAASRTTVTDVAWDAETGLSIDTATDYYLLEAQSTADDVSVVAPTTQTVVTGVTYASDTLSYAYGQLKYIGSFSAVATPTLFTAVVQTVCYDVAYSGGSHALQKQTVDVTVLEAGTPAAAVNILAAVGIEWIEDVTYDGSTGLNKESRSSGYMLGELGSLGSPANIVGFTNASDIYSIAWSGTALSATGQTLKLLGGAATPSSPATLFTTTTASLVSNVHFTDPDEMQDFYTVQVFGATAGTTDDVIWSGDECGGE